MFIVSIELLEYGYCELDGVRVPSINIDNINATSQETLCLINNSSNALSYRWSRPHGGVL